MRRLLLGLLSVAVVTLAATSITMEYRLDEERHRVEVNSAAVTLLSATVDMYSAQDFAASYDLWYTESKLQKVSLWYEDSLQELGRCGSKLSTARRPSPSPYANCKDPVFSYTGERIGCRDDEDAHRPRLPKAISDLPPVLFDPLPSP